MGAYSMRGLDHFFFASTLDRVPGCALPDLDSYVYMIEAQRKGNVL